VTPPTIGPEAELMLRLEQLRRRINADARRAVWQIVVALAVAFAAGVAIGKLWR
jgi:hypothetical protein